MVAVKQIRYPQIYSSAYAIIVGNDDKIVSEMQQQNPRLKVSIVATVCLFLQN